MMTHCSQATPQTKERWFSPLVEAFLVATIVMAALQPSGRAAAAEYFVYDDTREVQERPSWEVIISPIQARPAIVTRDCFCKLIPYLNSSGYVLARADNPGITTLTTCLSPNTWKTDLLEHVMLGPGEKVNSRTTSLRVFTFSYNNKRQVRKIRTTPPELKRSTHYTPAASIIGPIQDFQDSPPSDELNMTPTIPSIPPLDTTSSLFGNLTWGPFNQFKGLERLPNGESHRMNLTTASTLHGRDCVSDCP
jgi:hypothetical protein